MVEDLGSESGDEESHYTIQQTLSRSNSALEEEQTRSLSELRALADAMAEMVEDSQDPTVLEDSQEVEELLTPTVEEKALEDEAKNPSSAIPKSEKTSHDLEDIEIVGRAMRLNSRFYFAL